VIQVPDAPRLKNLQGLKSTKWILTLLDHCTSLENLSHQEIMLTQSKTVIELQVN
jgi:hypothetical protein